MITTHKLVIIPMDGTVIGDNIQVSELDLYSCGVPEYVHALQWNNPLWPDRNNSHLIGLEYGQGTGWIEVRSNEPNIPINELPEWAINCYDLAIQTQSTQVSNDT